jgi:hypothetical protein
MRLGHEEFLTAKMWGTKCIVPIRLMWGRLGVSIKHRDADDY